MTKLDKREIWDFSKYALERNDEAIRFSEAKAAVLLTIVGVIIGGLVDNVRKFQKLMSSDILTIRIFTYACLFLIGVGFLVVIISTILIILPRLHVVKNKSFLFFGDNAHMNEEEFVECICKSSKKYQNHQIITQVLATSKIAQKKFYIFQISIVGMCILLTGYFLSIILFLIF
jgi:hypothetical protein